METVAVNFEKYQANIYLFSAPLVLKKIKISLPFIEFIFHRETKNAKLNDNHKTN